MPLPYTARTRIAATRVAEEAGAAERAGALAAVVFCAQDTARPSSVILNDAAVKAAPAGSTARTRRGEGDAADVATDVSSSKLKE